MKLTAKRIKKLRSKIKYFDLYSRKSYSFWSSVVFTDPKYKSRIYGLDPIDAMHRLAKKENRENRWFDRAIAYCEETFSNNAEYAILPENIKDRKKIKWFSYYFYD